MKDAKVCLLTATFCSALTPPLPHTRPEKCAMRIAMFSWESLHSITVGGVAPHVTELAAALQRRGHEVHVFTRRKEGQQLHEEGQTHTLRHVVPAMPSSLSCLLLHSLS